MTRTRSLILLIAMASMVPACGGGEGGGPPVNPAPAGSAVEVGGWYPVDTLLVGMSSLVERTGDRQAKGWMVTVVDPGACTMGTAVAGKEFICVGVEICNTSAGAGGLDLKSDLPVLADTAGERVVPVELRIAAMDFVGLGQQASSVSTSTNCTFSAPDSGGRQQGDCTAVIAIEGGGEGMTSGWAAAGANKTASFDFAFLVSSGKSGWALQWPDGTWLALP